MNNFTTEVKLFRSRIVNYDEAKIQLELIEFSEISQTTPQRKTIICINYQIQP